MQSKGERKREKVENEIKTKKIIIIINGNKLQFTAATTKEKEKSYLN